MKTSHAAARPAVHPRAGLLMTGAETIVQVLADEGVDIIFGYSGGAILPTYDAMPQAGISFMTLDATQRPTITADLLVV